jgi:hypothetical protein
MQRSRTIRTFCFRPPFAAPEFYVFGEIRRKNCRIFPEASHSQLSSIRFSLKLKRLAAFLFRCCSCLCRSRVITIFLASTRTRVWKISRKRIASWPLSLWFPPHFFFFVLDFLSVLPILPSLISLRIIPLVTNNNGHVGIILTRTRTQRQQRSSKRFPLHTRHAIRNKKKKKNFRFVFARAGNIYNYRSCQIPRNAKCMMHMVKKA